MTTTLDDLRVRPEDDVDLDDWETRSTLWLDDKDGGKARLDDLQVRIHDLQRDLWAENQRSILLVLQGMDTSGKDGTIRRVLTGVNPHGIQVASFKQPTDVELDHDFLWRIHKAVPSRGKIGVFNRSHYEDVGVVRVLGLVDDERAERRFRQIRDFERHLTEHGTAVRKVFLHISQDEQKERLQERIDRPEKHWKFSLGDLETRAQWDRYMEVYGEAIAATSTTDCPWYVVPADRKWVRDVAVAQLLVDTLEAMAPQPPPPDPELEGIVIE